MYIPSYKDSSVGGASGSTEDSRSLTDSIADVITEPPQTLDTSFMTQTAVAKVVGATSAQVAGAVADTRGTVADQVSVALATMKASASNITTAKGITKGVGTSEELSTQNSEPTSKGGVMIWC